MTSAFHFSGGTANLIKLILTTTNPTPIPFGTNQAGQFNVPLFRVSEYAGGTPNLTVELYDVANTTSYYLGASSFTWKVKTMTAFQSLLFDDGYAIPNNWQLRITATVANQVMVTGLYIGKQATPNWQPGTVGGG